MQIDGHYFSQIRYVIDNHQGGDQNNFNVRIYNPDGSLAWSWNSPDNRESNVQYGLRVINPNVRVFSGSRVQFTAIFDWLLESDPQCTARLTVV